MDNCKDLKEIIEKQAALNHKLAAMALELDTERAKNASLCKEVSRLKSLIGESGQELWSAENQRADWLEAELEQVKRERDAAKGRLAAYEELGSANHLRELVQAEQDGRLVVLPCRVGDTVWYITSTMEICEAEVTGIWLNAYTNPKMWLEIKYYSRSIGEYEYKSRVDLMLGKTVFLTREEAEAALKGGAECTL